MRRAAIKQKGALVLFYFYCSFIAVVRAALKPITTGATSGGLSKLQRIATATFLVLFLFYGHQRETADHHHVKWRHLVNAYNTERSRKNAKSLMDRHFATVCRRDMRYMSSSVRLSVVCRL